MSVRARDAESELARSAPCERRRSLEDLGLPGHVAEMTADMCASVSCDSKPCRIGIGHPYFPFPHLRLSKLIGCTTPIEQAVAGRISHFIKPLLERRMNKKLIEDEMRRALFGDAEISTSINTPVVHAPQPEVVVVAPVNTVTKKKASKAFTPRLRVTLRVGNEFEGETYEITHEADTLSTLLAQQEATKAAKKKFRYVEVVSVKSM